ncbi:hypothetical protein AGMMS4956_14160 [Bacteroidia bacterium]|nr:hypothetical protein AGMMS4956_14160 [Bacteroidia bacterium]
MAEVRSVGLKSIRIGEIANDGDMGTVLEALGVTYKGTASLTTEEGTTTDFFSEENVYPEESVKEPGTTKLAWNIINLDPEALQKCLGGDVVAADGDNPAVWKAPADVVNIEKSIEVLTAFGMKIQIPRANISATMQWNLARTEIAQVAIVATVLKPAKEGVAPYSVSKVAVV